VGADFKLPYINQFSLGFQYKLPGQSSIELTYSGSRGKDLQSSLGINLLDLGMRNQCYIPTGGNPLYCDQQVPNPFYGLEPFRGTNLYTRTNVARSSLAVPYPHFGGLTNVTRNDCADCPNRNAGISRHRTLSMP
jgi:hypothetical protein